MSRRSSAPETPSPVTSPPFAPDPLPPTDSLGITPPAEPRPDSPPPAVADAGVVPLEEPYRLRFRQPAQRLSCPRCRAPLVAGSSPQDLTYYYCSRDDCEYSAKRGRGVATCPAHREPLVLDRVASARSIFDYWLCPREDCPHEIKLVRRAAAARYQADGEPQDFSAR